MRPTVRLPAFPTLIIYGRPRVDGGDMGAMLLPKLLISKGCHALPPYRRQLLFMLVVLVAPVLSNAQEPSSPTPQPASSADDLIRILENGDARNALLSRLKSEAAAQQVQAPVEEDSTFARQIAEQTRAAAEQIVAGGEAVCSGVAALAVIFTGTSTIDYGAIQALILNVILVGAGLFASFFVLRMLAHILQRTLDGRAASRHWSIRAVHRHRHSCGHRDCRIGLGRSCSSHPSLRRTYLRQRPRPFVFS